jgi:sulfur-oxidizing protein SoxY
MPSRRQALTQAATVAALMAASGMWPGGARAQAGDYPKAAFETRSMDESLKALGHARPVASPQIQLGAPDIAENGAQVPLDLSTALPGVKRLMLLIEKNPNILAAVFDLSEGIEPSLSTRVKMSESSNVYGVAVLADGRVLFARKQVRVTIGGCGV